VIAEIGLAGFLKNSELFMQPFSRAGVMVVIAPSPEHYSRDICFHLPFSKQISRPLLLKFQNI
jgi:hypothetical protein